MSAPPAQELLINRSRLEQAEIVTSDANTRPLEADELRCRIDCFGLSANNITYAVLGDMMHYWDLFPTRPGWGRMPVWGFAEIIESRCDGLSAGERLYGLFPAASHIILHAGQVNATSFMEISPQRATFASIYNLYTRHDAVPLFKDVPHDQQAALRPLFMTSFLIDAFLEQHDFFGADMIVLASASSKTAFGTAALLKAHRKNSQRPHIVGLTSAANLDFVKALDCYDTVLDYANITALDNTIKAVYVDMSGNVRQQKNVHTHFGENMMYSCWVGATHWKKLVFGIQLPGPEPVLFSAPVQFQQRINEWGNEALNQRFHAAWSLLNNIAQSAIQLHPVKGEEEILQAYLTMLNARCKPAAAHVLSFS